MHRRLRLDHGWVGWSRLGSLPGRAVGVCRALACPNLLCLAEAGTVCACPRAATSYSPCLTCCCTESLSPDLPPPSPPAGHSYLAYGPLLNRATQVVFEGVPTHPNPGRCWEVVDKWQVKQFYTAPTAIRSLMRSGEEWVKKHDRGSLRVLGSVGEPINPEAWKW